MLAPNTGKLSNGIVGAVAWVATKLAQGHRCDTSGRCVFVFRQRSCLERTSLQLGNSSTFDDILSCGADSPVAYTRTN